MQALAWNIRHLSELLEAYGCVDEITQNYPSSLWFPVDEQRRSLIKELFREGRVTLNSSDYCIFEISRQCHCAYLFGRLLLASARTAAFLALYSA